MGKAEWGGDPVCWWFGLYFCFVCCLDEATSLVVQVVKCLPIMRETWVWSFGWEDPLWKEMATHSSTLAWKIPRMDKCGSLQSMGWQRATWLSNFTFFLSCTRCYWWLGDAGSYVQVLSLVWMLTILYSQRLVLLKSRVLEFVLQLQKLRAWSLRMSQKVSAPSHCCFLLALGFG